MTPPAGVAGPVRRGALALAGRPGQRRAVRTTAVALALLALALGARTADRDGAGTGDGREQQQDEQPGRGGRG